MTIPPSDGAEVPEFIVNAGACLVTRSILEHKSLIKWALREESANPADNGWRIFGHTDTSDYLNDPANLAIVDYNRICAMEPALIGIYRLPVGSDLQLVVDEAKRRTWYDNTTGQPLTDL